MKRVIFSLILVMGLATFGNVEAQNRKDRGDRNRNMPKEMRLTEEQRNKMRDIDTQFKEKIEKINKTKLTAEERRTQMSELRKEKREAKKKVLTEEQKKYFSDKNWGKDRGDRRFGNKNHDRNRDNNRGRNWDKPCIGADKSGCCLGNGMMRGKNMRGACPYISDDLQLTDDQKEKIKKLWDNNQKDREQMRTKHRDEMKKILTPEQLKKFEERWNK